MNQLHILRKKILPYMENKEAASLGMNVINTDQKVPTKRVFSVVTLEDDNFTLFKIGLNGKTKINKNTSNQTMDTTFNNQLFQMYNFVAWPKKICSL